MMKSNLLFLICNMYPMFLNILMLLIMSLPTKNNKFNPITLILLLIIMSTLMSLKMNFFINSWSSFSLFLIMIGGLMIIFMYIMSIANNELFMINYKTLSINLFKILPLIMLTLYIKYNLFDFNNSNLWFNMSLNNSSLTFYEMYLFPFSNNTIFIMNYLFYSMICIMNICYKFKSPLRQLMF